MHRILIICFVCFASLLVISPAWAQSGFIVVDFGSQFGTEGFRQDAGIEAIPGSSLGVGYPVGYSGIFDAGGGVFVTPSVGLGATVTYTRQSQTATTFADVSIPAFAGDTVFRVEGEADFDRSELGLHIQVAGKVPVNERVSVTFYGGPSWINVSQDVVSVFIPVPDPQNPRLNAQTQNVSDSAWGFNVGADVAYFFNDNLGLGGGLRYTRATVELANVVGTRSSGTGQVSESRAGGAHAVVGLRVRF